MNSSTLELAVAFHGHRCPAMVLGMRVGLAAMKALGVGRAVYSELYCVCETGLNHAMMCFADGVQVVTGCTFGKANMESVSYDKTAMTLIAVESRRAVRATVNAEALKKFLTSRYFRLRSSGVEMFDYIRSLPPDQVASVGEVRSIGWDPTPPSFDWQVCAKCGEVTFRYGLRTVNGRQLCIPCARSTEGGRDG